MESKEAEPVHATFLHSPSHYRRVHATTKTAGGQFSRMLLSAHNDVKREADFVMARQVSRKLELEDVKEREDDERKGAEAALRVQADEDEVLARQLQEEEEREAVVMKRHQSRQLEQDEAYCRKLAEEDGGWEGVECADDTSPAKAEEKEEADGAAEEAEEEGEEKEADGAPTVREDEDEALAQRLQREEVREMEARIARVQETWKHPKVSRRDQSKRGVMEFSVHLPFVERVAVALDPTTNVVHVRAESFRYRVSDDVARMASTPTRRVLGKRNCFSLEIELLDDASVSEGGISYHYDDASETVLVRLSDPSLRDMCEAPADEPRAGVMARLRQKFSEFVYRKGMK